MNIPGFPPTGCAISKSGWFNIGVENDTSITTRAIDSNLLSLSLSLGFKGDERIQRRQDDVLYAGLFGGNLTDSSGRIGYVATNGQFRFDSPPLVNQLFINPFSICENSSIALGSTTNWYYCVQEDFWRLYYVDSNNGTNCSRIKIKLYELRNSTMSSATSSTASSTATAAINTSTWSSATPATNTFSKQPGRDWLTGAEVAKFIVGPIIGLAILTSAVVFYVIRHRKQARGSVEMDGVPRKFELYAGRPPVEASSIPVGELHGSDVPELYGSDVPELYGSDVPELDGRGRRWLSFLSLGHRKPVTTSSPIQNLDKQT